MKENKAETIIVIIMVILIICMIIFTIYKVANSTTSLRLNEPYNNNVSNNNYIKDENTNSNKENNNENNSLNDKTLVKPDILLSTFSTNIYDNDVNRVENIALAISKINEKILNPGEVFSFNETVGPMDYDHGFKDSTAFDSNGNKIKVPGGGMCQISSTMYNAALEANFEIIERHPHSRRVEYVPVDRDATIYYDTLDFKFKNNTDSKIKITASSDQYNVTINIFKTN